MLSAVKVLLGQRSPEPIANDPIDAAGSDLFVNLGKVTVLTGRDENGGTGDGGEIKGWVYKQSSAAGEIFRA